MLNLQNFVFFDTTSTSQVSNDMANPNGASAVTLQVEPLYDGAPVSLEVQGMSDLARSDSYFPIKTVGLGDFKTYTTITKGGLYMFPIEGLQKIRLKSNVAVGSFKAYAISVG